MSEWIGLNQRDHVFMKESWRLPQIASRRADVRYDVWEQGMIAMNFAMQLRLNKREELGVPSIQYTRRRELHGKADLSHAPVLGRVR